MMLLVGIEFYYLEQKNRILDILIENDDPRGPWKSSDMLVRTYSAKCDYKIITPSGRKVNPPKGRCWRFREKYEEMKKDNRIFYGNEGNSIPSVKRFLSEVNQGIVPSTIWFREDSGDNQEAAKQIRQIFNNLIFDTPKPTRLIKRMIELSCDQGDIILDFFAGSATTAHAVMQLNAKDGGNRKFIIIQLPEPTPEKSEAFKAGYHNISEIGKDRIRLSGEKILSEIKQKEQTSLETNQKTSNKFDIGFKVLKLDSSNFVKWNSEYDNFATSTFR